MKKLSSGETTNTTKSSAK